MPSLCSAAILLLGSAAALFAVLMFLQRTLYASAICFLVVLMQIAALFYLMGAQLLAFLLLLIYAGAVMVLIVMAIMANPGRLEKLQAPFSLPKPLLWAALLLPCVELAALAALSGPRGPALPAAAAWPTISIDFASALFGRFAILTELVGLMVFVAALAVVQSEKRP